MHTESFHARDPDDRRQHERRDEDVELTVAAETKSAVEAWSALMLIKRAPLTITVATVASLATFVFTNLGFRVTGTPQEIAALNTKVARNDSLTNLRLLRVEQQLSQRADDIRELQESVRFLSYVVCIQIRRADPAAAPPGCDPIIRSRGDAAR